jgi:hypothetical protein
MLCYACHGGQDVAVTSPAPELYVMLGTEVLVLVMIYTRVAAEVAVGGGTACVVVVLVTS